MLRQARDTLLIGRLRASQRRDQLIEAMRSSFLVRGLSRAGQRVRNITRLAETTTTTTLPPPPPQQSSSTTATPKKNKREAPESILTETKIHLNQDRYV